MRRIIVIAFAAVAAIGCVEQPRSDSSTAQRYANMEAVRRQEQQQPPEQNPRSQKVVGTQPPDPKAIDAWRFE